MKLLQKLGFVKEDEAPVVQENVQQKQQPIQQPQSFAPQQTGGTDYTKYFEEVFEKNDLPGLDYREFNKTLESFNNKPISEQQKYEFAFAAFSASGVNLESLIQSVSHYQGLLDAEERDFKSGALSMKSDVEALGISLSGYNQQIQELNAKVQALNEEIYKKNNELSVEEQGFTFHIGNVRAIINDKVKKIKQYLQNAKPTNQP